MLVTVSSPRGYEYLELSHADYDDGYWLAKLDKVEAAFVEHLEGDGPGVMVCVEDDLFSHRGGVSYRGGNVYLRWDPKSVKEYHWED